MGDRFLICGIDGVGVCDGRVFLQEDFVLNCFPVMKWDKNCQFVETSQQLVRFM